MTGFLKRLAIAVVVLALFSVFLINTGMWDKAIIDPIRYAAGGEVAEKVDDFGQGSKTATDSVTDYVQRAHAAAQSGDPLNPDYGALLESLAGIAAPSDRRIPEYRREEFGDGWLDLDSNGCRTRDEILARDLDAVGKEDTCTVAAGTLADPYTGKTISFIRGEQTSQAVQIDHVVPLAAAWVSGAAGWSREKREAFANDPANLLAVDGPTNSEKQAKTVSQWLPPQASYACAYVTRYVTVIALYDLSMSDQDRAKANDVLASCE